MKSAGHQILELDCGNTRGKWRLIGGRNLVEESRESKCSGVFEYQSGFASVLSELSLQSSQLAGCRVVSVAPTQVNTDLELAWASWSDAPIKFAKVERECAGVICGYDDLTQLGVDRWSAIVGASQQLHCPLVVLDAGTALTADVIDSSNHHLGGFILPGLELMLESLREKTAIPDDRIPNVDALLPAGLGKSTSAAISGGVAGAVSAFCSRVFSLADASAQVVITGGNTEQVTTLCGADVKIMPNLVFEGLSALVPMEVNGL